MPINSIIFRNARITKDETQFGSEILIPIPQNPEYTAASWPS